MSLRRSVALTAGVLLLGAPALTSCGFDYPTNRVNTIANGATDRSNSVYVLNALVVASRPGSGTLVTTLSNRSDEEAVRLVSVTGETEDGSLTTTQNVDVGLLPNGAANLANPPIIRVGGEFGAGEFITLRFDFDSGEQISVEAPVVTDCDEYDGLDLAPPLTGTKASDAEEEYDCEPPSSHSETETSEEETEADVEEEPEADTAESE